MGTYVSLHNMDIKATNVFKKNYSSKARYVINRWGTRSSKTYSLAQICALRLYTWVIEEGWEIMTSWYLSVVRKYSTTLKNTAMRDFECVIDDMGIRSVININKTDKTYTFWNRVVEFFWADNEQKLRWGTRDILYCNEANELSYENEFFQLMIRTKKKIFIDFNPDSDDIWINTELEQKRSKEVWDVDVIVSTYKDNPFLPTEQVQEIERLESTNEKKWRVYWLWEYGKLEWLIFSRWSVCKSIPDYCQLIWYWLDFWYANDPTALIAIYKWDNAIFLDEIIYEKWLTNQDIDAMVTSIWIDKSDLFVADCAEPKSIEELYRRNRNIVPCVKWKDSIQFGIDLMLQFEFRITAESESTIREFKNYCREIDKNGIRTNKPESWYDHAIDAIRYLIIEKFDTRVKKKKEVKKDERPRRNYITGELIK